MKKRSEVSKSKAAVLALGEAAFEGFNREAARVVPSPPPKERVVKLPGTSTGFGVVAPKVLERTPDGTINNCALANGASESDCQICNGKCPEPNGREIRTKDREPDPLGELMMGRGFDRIRRTLFDLEATLEEHQQLRGELTFVERASSMSYGELVDALDRARDRAMRSVELHALAVVTREQFEITCSIEESAYWTRAREELQALKDGGRMSKTITDKDVTIMVAKLYPANYRAITAARAECEQMVKVYEQLAKQWSARGDDLRQMVARSRAV